MARKTQDEEHKELESILQELLEKNVNITAREIARRHSALSSASTITRHPHRRQLVEIYQQRQSDMRNWQSRLGKQSKEKTSELIADQEAKISELEQAVRSLVAGHLSLIAAVAETGGMGRLLKYYERFSQTRNELLKLKALPDEMGKSNTSDMQLKRRPNNKPSSGR